MRSVLESKGWQIVYSMRLPERKPVFVSPAALDLAPETMAYLARMPAGIYRHQHRALEAFRGGANVCLTTGTASGKTLAFVSAAIERLARNPFARVLAVYPLKALAQEQETRWRQALQNAGLPELVGRIDGSVPTAERESTLRQSRVVLATPDVLHAWLLGSLSNRAVREFVAALELAVVDEVHVYTGVFGSNSAFLFRRLRHAVGAMAAHRQLRFIGASATIADPVTHLDRLFGVQFTVIGEEDDTSPRQAREVLMIRPPQDRDLFTEIPELLNAIVEQTDYRFLAFVDSRRQTEQLASILARKGAADEVAAGRESAAELSILPYRSGFEAADRTMIQARLTDGSLRGVISTSALELGLDIPDMDAAILIGVPQSGTSLQQRIGRVGRHRPGHVLVIDTGGIADGAAFRDPAAVFDRPLAPTALYLNNRSIQYIHALSFASPGGEYDTLRKADPEATESGIETSVDWPEGFIDLCLAERAGSVPVELQAMKSDASDDPWHAFPLRDVGSQFAVESSADGGQPLGSVSHSQLMREAYPGAVYYYMTTPYRVTKVLRRDKKIIVRREKRYTTNPSGPPVRVIPQLNDCQTALGFGELQVIECGMYISEVLTGFTERRGPNQIQNKYPNEYWRRDRFSRNYSSTGVLLTHPSLNAPGVDPNQLAGLILEAFLLVAPFERTDVSASHGRFGAHLLDFAKGDHYLAVYDQTYGSLRLSGHLTDPEILRAVLKEALATAESGRLADTPPSDATLGVVRTLIRLAEQAPRQLAMENRLAGSLSGDTGSETVIMPGSIGWIITDDNQEFEVKRVLFHPREGLVYRGRRVGAAERPDVEVSFPVANVQPVPGLSRMGRYYYDTGDVTAIDE